MHREDIVPLMEEYRACAFFYRAVFHESLISKLKQSVIAISDFWVRNDIAHAHEEAVMHQNREQR
jgi:hypothetical protein